MLTPRFELSQTEDEVTIVIHAPYSNIKDAVVHVEGTDFRFYATPYYLRLNLPGEIEENDQSTGQYDCEKGDYVLKLSKVHKGEHFENLDMITTLLTPSKTKKDFIPTIEVISNPCTSGQDDANKGGVCTEDSINEVSDDEKTFSTEPNSDLLASEILLHRPKYGFANKICGALKTFEDAWVKEIIDLPSPDKTLPENRQKLRKKHEFESFSEEHYMADLIETECVEPYLSYESCWEKITAADVILNEEEIDRLKELPNKEYLLDENETKTIYYGMVDILFASCYNTRTTLGENTVESAWTINKLSATLSWFQTFTNMRDVIISSTRRSLCYPLVRNWNLSMKVFQDVKDIVKLGKKCIIKRFVEIYSLFNNSSEPRYILNQLYIKDYLVWLQQVPTYKITEIFSLLEMVDIKKEELGLDLVELEEAAYAVQKENLVIKNELYSLPEDLQKLIISNDPSKQKNSNTELIAYSESDSDSSTSSSSSSSSESSDDSDVESDSDKIIDTSNNSNNDILDSDDEPN